MCVCCDNVCVLHIHIENYKHYEHEAIGHFNHNAHTHTGATDERNIVNLGNKWHAIHFEHL